MGVVPGRARRAARADDPRALARAVALVPRRLGKGDLVLTARDLREADEVRPGFDPTGLTLDQAARIALLLASYRDPGSFAQAIEALCRTADLGEFIAIYRGLALFPAPEHLVGRAAEGVRSGIKPIFEAVAHRNPYPAEMFDRSTWNQMVLKALFIGSELRPIQRLDERANPELAAILVDYAHERWSAGRPVSPELWRCVGPFADRRALADLERVLETGAAAERSAAALALSASNEPAARAILCRHPGPGGRGRLGPPRLGRHRRPSRHERRGDDATGTELMSGRRDHAASDGVDGPGRSFSQLGRFCEGSDLPEGRRVGTMSAAFGLAFARAWGARLKGGDHGQASHRHGGRRGDCGDSRVRPNRRSQPAQRSKSRGHLPAGRQLRAGTGVVHQPGRPGSVASRLERVHRKRRAPEQRTEPGTDLSSGEPLLIGTRR